MAAGVTRRYAQAGTIYPSLVAMYADALSRALDHIHTHGLLREYERREMVTSMPHGRILVGQAMQGAGGSAIAGLRPLGTLAGMNVSLYVFDLDAEDLDDEERRFVQAIRDRS